MGAHYEPEKHHADFETWKQITRICTVNDYEEAKKLVVELKESGFGAVELCGAFGQEKAKELAELTEHKVAVGYIVHDADMDELFAGFFGR